MLNFADGFFKPEIREDFQIDATMKTVWAAQLEVLNEIDKVCERHGLTWYMAFGSLLGTVRHQGFIPWDDDMDIWLKREDYMQLLQYLPEELPEDTEEALCWKAGIRNITPVLSTVTQSALSLSI